MLFSHGLNGKCYVLSEQFLTSTLSIKFFTDSIVDIIAEQIISFGYTEKEFAEAESILCANAVE